MKRSTAEKVRNSIKGVMDSKRIKTPELANLAGLSYGAVNNILNGETDNPTINSIERIADALDMTVVGLINWRGKS